MTTDSVLHEAGAMGRRFLRLESRGHQTLAEYNWTLSQLYDLLKYTHSIVVSTLERIESADSVDAARAHVNELRGDALTRTFRVKGLCDVLEGFGKSLRRLVEPGKGYVDPSTVTAGGHEAWVQFCETLEQKEEEVAALYAWHIRELRDLIDGASSEDLGEIKRRAREAKATLTSQMSDFGALADDFRAAGFVR
jgi:hypothetical protein